jgi:hypothetical protein
MQLCPFGFVQGWLLNELECFLYEYDSISVTSEEKKKLLTGYGRRLGMVVVKTISANQHRLCCAIKLSCSDLPQGGT